MPPLGDPGVADLRIDLTFAGQVFNALSAYAGVDELERDAGVLRYDAVVHFAAIPAILVRPDNETFRINALSTYNIIDAAVKLGTTAFRDGLRDLLRRRRGQARVRAERAVSATLGSFSQAARKAATDTTPHVNLVDGEKIWELVERRAWACARQRSSTLRGSTGSSDIGGARERGASASETPNSGFASNSPA